jgi:hypothetical protein
MAGTLKKAGVVFVALIVLLFAAAFVIRPTHTNPPTDASHTIQAQVKNTELLAVLDRSCSDCHSNSTAWSRYNQRGVVSWLMSYGVTSGRKAMNLSEWGAYTAQQQRSLLNASCQDATTGKMPGAPYIKVRPEARLSAADIETICKAARAGENLTSR